MLRPRLGPPLGLLLLLPLIGAGCERDPVNRIRSLHEAGRYDESLAPLENLLEKRPGDSEIQYLYGIANLRTGRFSQALWPLRQARDTRDWALPAGEALAAAALGAADPETAIEAATRVIEAKPDQREMLFLRAEAHLNTDHFQEALGDVERLEALDPDDEDVVPMRLQCLLGLGRLDEVEALFVEQDAQWSDPESPGPAHEGYCAARATFASEKDQDELAEQRFGECLKAFPTSFLVVRAALTFYDKRSRPDRAIEILRSMLEGEPSASMAREQLATRLRSLGRVDEAEAVLLEGTRLDSTTALNAWGGLAAHYFQIGDFAASASAWEEVMKLVDEPESRYLFGYAEALLRAGRYDRALEVAQKLPESNAGIIRGLVLLEQKRPAEALREFDAGSRLWPNHPEARLYTAIAAERAGDFDRAIGEYRQSLRSERGATDAGLRLAELHEAEGSYEKAYQAISMYVQSHPDDAEGHLAALRIAAASTRGSVRVESISLPQESRAHFAAKAAEIIGHSASPKVAIEFLENASDLDLTQPRDAEALHALVTQLFAAGRGREARGRVEKALAAHPDTASFHAAHALVLERSGAPASDVRAAYTRAIELDPNCAPALAALARRAAEDGDTGSARGFYARAAAADPNDLDSRRRAAELAVSAGDLDDARARSEALLEDRPYDAEAAMDLAALLVRRGTDPARVRSLARQAVRFGGTAPAYALLVDTHLEAGEAKNAVAVLRAAALRRATDASLQYQLGRALAGTGNSDAAREAFEAALAVGDFPERGEAATALAALPSKPKPGDG